MTSQEIFEKAIQKAIDGGWIMWGKANHYYQCRKCKQEAAFTEFNGEYDSDCGGKWEQKQKLPDLFPYDEDWLLGYTDASGDFQSIRLSEKDIIFNHDFAKALWGEELVVLAHAPLPGYPKIMGKGEKGRQLLHRWQHHLQQLVIADDVFKYLEEHAL